MLKRKIYDNLLSWKNKEKGSCALLVEGARRVGKTTIIEEFGRNEYESYVLIDFSVKDKGIMDTFENHSSNLDDFFVRLQLVTSKRLFVRNSLIIFDEVQNYPYARQMIKHLVADGRFDYIETGSLISIRKNVKGIQIPSEERHLEMFPMDFEEFLWARGDDVSVSALKILFDKKEALGKDLHRKIMDSFSMYMVVGGMPQVVDRFLSTGNLMEAEKVKRDIIGLCRSDLSKLPGQMGSRALMVFDRLPALLSSHSKVFSPGKVETRSRARQYDRSIAWLKEAKLINLCERVDDPNVAHDLNKGGSRFKCYFMDTGLLVSMAFGRSRPELEESYRLLMGGRLSINEGMFFENVVAQELRAKGHDLLFSTFRHGASTAIYEIDFLIPGARNICPVEVKSSVSVRHASLDMFMEKFGKRVDAAYVVHAKDLRTDGRYTYLPAYMTMFL